MHGQCFLSWTSSHSPHTVVGEQLKSLNVIGYATGSVKVSCRQAQYTAGSSSFFQNPDGNLRTGSPVVGIMSCLVAVPGRNQAGPDSSQGLAVCTDDSCQD